MNISLSAFAPENLVSRDGVGSPVSRQPVHLHTQAEYVAAIGTALPNPSRETKFSGANGEREILIIPVQLTTSRIGNLTRLVHILATVYVCDHAYCTYEPLGFLDGIESPLAR